MDGVHLCHLSELPEGGCRGFDPTGEGRDTMFVVRREGLHGWLDACPHWEGAPMAWRKDAYLSGDRQHIACHAHGARFDIATGLCLQGPCVGQSLTPVPLLIDEDGSIRLAPEPETETRP